MVSLVRFRVFCPAVLAVALATSAGRVLSDERLPGGGNYYASPVAGDGKVYFASEAGMVSVVADEKDWRVISSQKFDSKIYGTPVLSGNHILIRTEDSIYCYERETAAP